MHRTIAVALLLGVLAAAAPARADNAMSRTRGHIDDIERIFDRLPVPESGDSVQELRNKRLAAIAALENARSALTRILQPTQLPAIGRGPETLSGSVAVQASVAAERRAAATTVDDHLSPLVDRAIAVVNGTSVRNLPEGEAERRWVQKKQELVIMCQRLEEEVADTLRDALEAQALKLDRAATATAAEKQEADAKMTETERDLEALQQERIALVREGDRLEAEWHRLAAARQAATSPDQQAQLERQLDQVEDHQVENARDLAENDSDSEEPRKRSNEYRDLTKTMGARLAEQRAIAADWRAEK